jgi:hypothetical protein
LLEEWESLCWLTGKLEVRPDPVEQVSHGPWVGKSNNVGLAQQG